MRCYDNISVTISWIEEFSGKDFENNENSFLYSVEHLFIMKPSVILNILANEYIPRMQSVVLEFVIICNYM